MATERARKPAVVTIKITTILLFVEIMMVSDQDRFSCRRPLDKLSLVGVG